MALDCPTLVCCPPNDLGYNQTSGRTYLNAGGSYQFDCPPGFICDGGGSVTIMIIPGELVWIPPPPTFNQDQTLTLECCTGPLSSTLSAPFTQAQFDAAVEALISQWQAAEAGCRARQTQAPRRRPFTNAQQSVNCPTGQSLQNNSLVPKNGVTVAANGLRLKAGVFTSNISKAAADASALAHLTAVFDAAIASGAIECVSGAPLCTPITVPDPPADFGVVDSTIFGPKIVCYNAPAPSACIPADFSFGVLDFGTYKVEYIEGASFDVTGGQFFVVDYPVHLADPTGQSLIFNSGIPGTEQFLPFDQAAEFYGTQAAAEAAYAASFAIQYPVGLQVIHVGADDILIRTNEAFESGAPVTDGAPNTTWRLRRIKKLLFIPPTRLRIANFASIKAALVPNFGATASAAPEWDGTFPLQNRFQSYSGPIQWLADLTPAVSLNGFLLDSFTKIYVGVGQPTGTGSAWVPSISFAGDPGVNWTGFGGDGTLPTGSALFRTDVAGNPLSGEKSAVRAATVHALPANTRTVNVLTASANGALPVIDGVTMAPGDRLLVKNETLTANNGWYEVTDLGSGSTPWVLTRSTDADTSAEVKQGAFCQVTNGTSNGNCYYRLTTIGAITLNTTGLVFTLLPLVITIEEY